MSANVIIGAGILAQEYQGTDLAPRIRIFVTEDFTASDSTDILRSSFEQGEFYHEEICAVDVNGFVNYPQLPVHSTTDALSNPDNAKYILCLFTSTGEFIQVVAKRLIVPPTPSTTSLSALEVIANGPPPVPPTNPSNYYTIAEMNAILAGYAIAQASQAEAEAGLNNSKFMTPLRVAQEILALGSSVTVASQAEAEAGSDNHKFMTPLRVAQEIVALVPANTIATQAEAQAGVLNNHFMTPLRVAEAIVALAAFASQSEAETGTNTTKYMSPLRVKQAIAVGVSALVNAAPSTLDTLKELADALGDDPNYAATTAALIGLKAPINSPTFTGSPKSVTPAPGTDDTSIATTEWVNDAVAAVVAGGSYTDEQAQDAVGGILVDSADIDFTYSDGTPSITAVLKSDIALAGNPTAATQAPGNSTTRVASTAFVTAADAVVLAAAETYADGLVVGLIDDRGNFDASANLFPTTGGSGAAGAVKKGDLWFISVAGSPGGNLLSVGDQIRALVDTPGQTLGNWAASEANITFTPENTANKVTSIPLNTGSTTKFPTVSAVEAAITAAALALASQVEAEAGTNNTHFMTPLRTAQAIAALGGGGGGGSIGLTYYEPNIPYAVPSAFDDEFNAGSLDGKWSTYNTIPTLSFPVPDQMIMAPSHVSQLRGIYQTPTWANGDTYIMKLKMPMRTGVGCSVGFLIIDAVGSKYSFTTTTGNASNAASFSFWTSNTTIFNTDNGTTNYGNPPVMFLKCKYDSSGTKKMVFSVSADSVIWTQVFSSNASGFNIDNSGAPTQFGIACFGTTTADGVAIDWIRKQQGSYTGASVTV